MPSRRFKRTSTLLVMMGLAVGAGFWLRFGTVQGVPSFIVLKFVMDKPARDAYFAGELRALHDRLNALGVEEDIKDFYRPNFKDEVELDWYIHQLLYERTGYIGKAYKLGANQTLKLKTRADQVFPQWFALAKKAGLVASYKEEEGTTYLIFPDGDSLPYQQFSEIYTLQMLRRMTRRQNEG